VGQASGKHSFCLLAHTGENEQAHKVHFLGSCEMRHCCPAVFFVASLWMGTKWAAAVSCWLSFSNLLADAAAMVEHMWWELASTHLC